MDDHGGGASKVTGIRQIVRLKELLQKWQSVTLHNSRGNYNNVHDFDHHHHQQSRTSGSSSSSRQCHHHHPGGISPQVSRRLRNSDHHVIMCESDEEGCQSPEPPADMPKGYLAVYVGQELIRRRFIIPTSYLGHHLFKVLLEKAEEEYGFDHNGALTIPCEIETFKYLLKCIETHPNHPAESHDHHRDPDA
ncbi:hypothetical protein Dimus_025830 [Dionaea muscipula]